MAHIYVPCLGNIFWCFYRADVTILVFCSAIQLAAPPCNFLSSDRLLKYMLAWNGILVLFPAGKLWLIFIFVFMSKFGCGFPVGDILGPLRHHIFSWISFCVKTKVKHFSQTHLCLMDGTVQCYMFRFSGNHHQAIHTKPLKHISSTRFCTIL